MYHTFKCDMFKVLSHDIYTNNRPEPLHTSRRFVAELALVRCSFPSPSDSLRSRTQCPVSRATATRFLRSPSIRNIQASVSLRTPSSCRRQTCTSPDDGSTQSHTVTRSHTGEGGVMNFFRYRICEVCQKLSEHFRFCGTAVCFRRPCSVSVSVTVGVDCDSKVK